MSDLIKTRNGDIVLLKQFKVTGSYFKVKEMYMAYLIVNIILFPFLGDKTRIRNEE
jgi:hypothetical protein